MKGKWKRGEILLKEKSIRHNNYNKKAVTIMVVASASILHKSKIMLSQT